MTPAAGSAGLVGGASLRSGSRHRRRLFLFRPWVWALVGLVALELAARLGSGLWLPVYVTVGGSMYPAVAPGEVAVLAAVSPSHLQAGEIVLARVPPVDQQRYGYAPLILHRIVRLDRAGPDPWMITKGDHNPGPDPFRLPLEAVVGRLVFLVPFVGYAILFAHSAYGLAAALGLLLLYGAYRVVDWSLRQAEAVEAGPGNPPAGLAASPQAQAPPPPPGEGHALALAQLLHEHRAVLEELTREVRLLREALHAVQVHGEAHPPPSAPPSTGLGGASGEPPPEGRPHDPSSRA